MTGKHRKFDRILLVIQHISKTQTIAEKVGVDAAAFADGDIVELAAAVAEVVGSDDVDPRESAHLRNAKRRLE